MTAFHNYRVKSTKIYEISERVQSVNQLEAVRRGTISQRQKSVKGVIPILFSDMLGVAKLTRGSHGAARSANQTANNVKPSDLQPTSELR